MSFYPVSPDRRIPSAGEAVIMGTKWNKLSGSEKILRMQRLYDAVPKFPPSIRRRKLEAIKIGWDEIQKMDPRSPGYKDDVLKRLNGMGENVSAIYAPEFETDEGRKKILKFMKDVDRISCRPVEKSTAGLKGPTLLVGYPTEKTQKSSVIKWTDPNEILSSRLYRAFSCCFSDEAVYCGFLVPYFSRLDFKQHLHERADGTFEELDLNMSQRIQSNYVQLAKGFDPQLAEDTTHVMVSERVQGKNLFDFSYGNYKDLRDEQKVKFFERLGRLALLDLILGNRDRMAQTEYAEGKFALRAVEANLGNVMVSFKDQEFDLYAIDNGIEGGLIESPEMRKHYIEFLQTLLSRLNWSQELTENIVSSIAAGVEAQIDDVDVKKIFNEDGSQGNLETVRRLLESFKKDLQELAPKAVESGLTSMTAWICEEILPKHWGSPKGLELRGYLSSVYPAFRESIEERLDVFNIERKA